MEQKQTGRQQQESIQKKQKEINAMLCDGLARKNMPMVLEALRHGADPNSRDKMGIAAILCAGESEGTDFLRVILETGADVNPGNDRSSPLGMAAMFGNTDAIRLLAAFGADVNAVDGYGKTPLENAFSIANEKKMLSTIDVLLDLGADVKKNTPGMDSLLERAIKLGSQKAVEKIIHAGADVHVRDKYGRPPVFYAAVNGDVSVLKVLLNHGVDINELDENGNTQLIWAVKMGKQSEEYYRFLIDNGIDLDAKNQYSGRTALMWSAWDNRTAPWILQMLLDSGADVNLTDNDGENALMFAATASLDGVSVKSLIDHGADVTSYAKDPRMVPAAYAMMAGNIVSFAVLSAAGGIDTLDIRWFIRKMSETTLSNDMRASFAMIVSAFHPDSQSKKLKTMAKLYDIYPATRLLAIPDELFPPEMKLDALAQGHPTAPYMDNVNGKKITQLLLAVFDNNPVKAVNFVKKYAGQHMERWKTKGKVQEVDELLAKIVPFLENKNTEHRQTEIYSGGISF